MAPHRVLLFGDQTVEKLPSIRELVRISRSSPVLHRFLESAADVVQTEVAKLGVESRKAFESFDDLTTLAEGNENENADEIVATALMCIVRLGELLLYVESDDSLLGGSVSTLRLLGFCTGLLPTAVAAVAKNTDEVIKYGLEMVAISVRLGAGLTARAQNVEEAHGCWAYTVVGATEKESQALIDGFHQRQNIPQHRHVYIGVASRTWTTIFGPPSVLDQLWAQTPELGLAPKLKLAANAPVHAAHLPMLDTNTIIGQSTLLQTPISARVQIISSSSCTPYKSNNLGDLLYQMMLDIAQHPLRLTETVNRIVSDVREGKEVDLIVVGPTAHTSLLQSAFRSVEVKVNVTHRAEKVQPVMNARAGSNLVAIVGMSGRFPGSDSVDQLWESLQEGREFHEKVPKSRFDIDQHFDSDGTLKNSLSTQWGCFLEKPGLFDSRLFNVSPREAAQMDPVQRLLLMSSYEAMEKAGYTQEGSLSTDSKRIATYMAQASDDWRSVNECQGTDIYYIPGIARAFTPGRLNYHFKWGGASHSIDAACAGGTTAVNLACSALISRECDTALAGGASMINAPNVFSGLSRGGFLSTTGGCKTFQESADGYCRGEGIGVVVLKRLEDAIADNDNIQAVITTSARTYSADAASITQPHAGTQTKLYKQVLHQASVDPADIGFIEMHGTGTKWGDKTEMQSVLDVFGSKRSKENPLTLGAVKANVGHGEAVAGITSLIKCAKILQEGVIPPQPGMPFKLNPDFPPLDKKHVRIASGKTPFTPRANSSGKKILLNNFDASGGNTCLIMEDAPARSPKGRDPRMWHVVTCSARTPYSLKENQKRLLQHLNTNPSTKISDIAYTTTARRMHDVFRSSYVTKNVKDLAQLITKGLNDTTTKPKPVGHRSSVVFAFTGQGSVYPGMGRQLFETCGIFRESVLSSQKICDSLGLPLVTDIITDSSADMQAKSNVQLQLALVVLEIGLTELWKSWGVKPDLVIGHSLGEYAALCVAGVLSVSDTLYLVGRRSTIMEAKCVAGSHAMLAVSTSVKVVEEALTTQGLSSCDVSCRNAPELSVVSGTIEDLTSLQQSFQSRQIKTKLLEVPYAFHSAQIDPILKDLGASARAVKFAKPLIPVASTLIASVVEDVGTFTPEYMMRQAREPVDFVGALQACKSKASIDEQTLWMEMGPGPVCLGMVRSSIDVPSAKLLPTIKSGEDNWKTISSSAAMSYLSNVPIAWTEFHREQVHCLTLLELPSYAFDLKEYWAPYKQELLVPAAENKAIQASALAPQKKTLPTTCLQYVEKESFEGKTASVSFSTFTSEPKLYNAIQGHLVDGTAICPASVFCDMALTAAKYIYSNAKANSKVPDMSVTNLSIAHPVVVTAQDPQQLIEVDAVMSKQSTAVQISFSTGEGAASHVVGGCEIQFGKNEDSKATYGRSLHLIKRRINDLTKSATAGLSHRLQRPIVYKLFASLVEYGDEYQGLEEVYMDNEHTDAAAIVKLRTSAGTGTFTESPYWIDSILHLVGFLLNGNVAHGDEVAYISTGLESLNIFEELSETKAYSTYVSIQPTEKKDVLSGDVYVFYGDTLVALCSSIHFHRMTKKILKAIFNKSPSKISSIKAPSAEVTEKGQQITQSKTRSRKRSDSDTANSSSSEADSNTPATSPQPSDAEEEEEPDNAVTLLGIVSSESGYDLGDMEPATLFTDMGVDSLMSIAIISAAQKQMGLELPATFFNEFPAVSDVRKEFGRAPKSSKQVSMKAVDNLLQTHPAPTSERSSSPGEDEPTRVQSVETTGPRVVEYESDSPSISEDDDTAVEFPDEVVKIESAEKHVSFQEKPKEHYSNTVLIRGRSTSKEAPLFLVTDGAGSAAAYIHLPALPTGNRIYALESPYLHCPQEYTCSVEEVASMYCAALRKVQPKGPYLLGGWSAGAVYAYEVAYQLLEQKEEILGLILIDMRVPRAMPDALEPTLGLIESAGLFTGIDRSGQSQSSASQKLKDHLVSTVTALTRYSPKAMDLSRRPNHTSVIWAKKGLSESESGDPFGISNSAKEAPLEAPAGNIMEDPGTGLKSWFYAKRNAFGPNGWDTLLGDVDCFVVDGADHFSMVVPPKVKILGGFLDTSVKKAMGRKA